MKISYDLYNINSIQEPDKYALVISKAPVL